MIEGKSPEEIRETFHLPDDLTEEEKLEPLRNMTDDPRIRLLNRLYARKRKELKEKQKLKNVEVEEEQCLDERSVDDLLSFINGGDGDTKGVRANKNKKKNRRKKDQAKNSSSSEPGSNSKEHNCLPSSQPSGVTDDVPSPSRTSKQQGSASAILSPKLDFDDGDIDDELDPAMKEELDRCDDYVMSLNL
nr:SKP1-like protein 21 isoform X1 [Ipomoea batatas]